MGELSSETTETKSLPMGPFSYCALPLEAILFGQCPINTDNTRSFIPLPQRVVFEPCRCRNGSMASGRKAMVQVIGFTPRRFSGSADDCLIPRLVDQDPWAQLRRPMDIIRQG